MAVIPEVRTLVERASARRHVLEGLIESIPEEFWGRQAQDDDWTALDHLRHVATVDGLVVELAEAARRTREALWVGGATDAAELEGRRLALMAAVAGQPVEDLVETMRASRGEAVEAVLALSQGALDGEVRVAGVLTAWGEPHTFSLRAYLGAWAEHDGEHEAAIRRAVETPPDFTTLTLAARRGRGPSR